MKPVILWAVVSSKTFWSKDRDLLLIVQGGIFRSGRLHDYSLKYESMKYIDTKLKLVISISIFLTRVTNEAEDSKPMH